MAKSNARKKKPGVKSLAPTTPKYGYSKLSTKTNPFANTPLYDILHVFERAPDQWAARYILILGAIVLKSAVGLGPFSGKGEKPINGDFEAQRHWMEITNHLPTSQWYFYDLQYWGLDYPPLTAFHLWLCGKIGIWINPEWFALKSSRGIETDGIKSFMRISVLISDLVIYVPAMMQLTSNYGGKKLNLGRMHQIVVMALILCQPCLVLIDHGHFQYNSVMLGFFLHSVIELMNENYVFASVWFMACLLFKQMGLYYSPFVFFFILSKMFTPGTTWKQTLTLFNLPRFIFVGITVVLTAFLLLLPFICAAENAQDMLASVGQIVHRVFPFERGLFEDKVANFWCTANVVIKFRTLFTHFQLKLLSLGLTLASILPPCFLISWKNLTRKLVPNSLILLGFSATAWGFFLFLFQVHEKTVLLPLIPSTFLLLNDDSSINAIVFWINNVAAFSLFPLLEKDGLVLQYVVMVILTNWFVSGFSFNRDQNHLWPSALSFLIKFVVTASYIAMIAVHVVGALVSPPSRYPDIWVLANIAISFACFAWFYCWLIYKIWKL